LGEGDGKGGEKNKKEQAPEDNFLINRSAKGH